MNHAVGINGQSSSGIAHVFQCVVEM